MFKVIIIVTASVVALTFATVLVSTRMKMATFMARSNALNPTTKTELDSIENSTIDISKVMPLKRGAGAQQYMLNAIGQSPEDPKPEVEIRSDTFQVLTCFKGRSDKHFRAWAIMVYVNGQHYVRDQYSGGGTNYLVYFKDGKPAGDRLHAGGTLDRIHRCPESFES